ncbi:MAG: OmpA family protein [Polyangiaceae bacterium]|nr:OmpA family protein [Polyangiaceae bacterium]
MRHRSTLAGIFPIAITKAKILCNAGAFAAVLLAASSVPAQTQGFALNRFRPAPPGDRLFGVESPYVAGDLVPHALLLADYAHNPLVLRRDAGDQDLGPVVSHQLFLHAAGSIALFSRVSFNVDIPLAVLQKGESPGAAGAGTFASPDSAELGDLRVGLRGRIYGGYFDPFQLAVGAYLWLPSGNDEAGSFVGDGSVRGMPQVIVGGRTNSIVWSFSTGVEIRPSLTYGQVTQGTMLHAGAGAGYLIGEGGHFQVGPELSFATVLEDVNRRTTNLELLLGAKYRFLSSFEAGAGLGLGLVSGVGTPDVRAVVMLAYTPELEARPKDRDNDEIADQSDACPDTRGVASSDPKLHGCPPPLPLPKPPDSDKDGIIDTADACPAEAGVASEDPKTNGCPPPKDGDKDGIVDELDACVEAAGVASEDPKKNGCPPDKDNDGVPDGEDACPDIAGVKTSDAATNGCPGDRDGDTIRDDKDACPDERGKPDEDPQKNGCPQSVRVVEGEIRILQQVQFDTGRATIKPVSNSLLDEVAEVVKQHPEIVKIEVQGHTDDRGDPIFNRKLSRDRAAAVVLALVERGVEASRLESKGYGSDKPIASNVYEAGRQQNRRVQFKILEKAPKP